MCPRLTLGILLAAASALEGERDGDLQISFRRVDDVPSEDGAGQRAVLVLVGQHRRDLPTGQPQLELLDLVDRPGAREQARVRGLPALEAPLPRLEVLRSPVGILSREELIG